MQPGGKRDAGEDDMTALAREIAEELGCCMVRDSIQPLGEFDAVAANEPGWWVHACLYGIDVTGDIVPNREIDEMIWIDPVAPPDIPLAPLTRDHVLPLASMGRVAGNA
jgi:8-oxo-dGTP diphosphatase